LAVFRGIQNGFERRDEQVAGKSNKEIGQALSIAEGTVTVHVNNLLGKLSVSDRTQAVTEALRRGIVHLD